MKTLKLIIIVVLSALSFNSYSQEVEKLTNQKIIELTSKKLGNELIIELINSYACDFNTDINSILNLKKYNVAEDVIHEMMKRTKRVGGSPSSVAGNNSEERDAGIYTCETRDGRQVFSKLYPSLVTNTKSGGYGTHLAKSFTMGFAKSSLRSELSGATANVKCNGQSTFYFYFDKSSNPKGDWWFNTASSPNEFVLIKLALNKKGNAREFRSGSSDSYSYSTGVDEDQKIAFTFEEVRSGVFVVSTKEKLNPGEYSFLYASQTPSQFTNNKIFDFSVGN